MGSVVRNPKTGRFERAPEDLAFKKAVGAVAKAFLTGNAAQMGPVMQPASTGGPRKPGTSWSNQGGTSSALIARVTQNLAQSFGKAPEDLELALAEQGLSWGPPFPPGRPLDPFWGYRRSPRTWDFAVGENVQIVPRWDRLSFGTLKAIYDAYDVAQICVRHLINDVRSLEYQFVAPPGVEEDVSADIAKARAFMEYPDRRQPFRAWLAEYLQDVLRYDAGTLYIRRNEMGEPIALEVVDGTTIIPLIDFFGRVAMDEEDAVAEGEGEFPARVVPGYLQIIEGLPWVWLTADDIIYQAWNPLPNSQYGLSPLEAVLLSANTDLRFQWHFLQYFTEGTLPAGFMEAPPDQSDPDSLAEWQETWDAIMLGDQSKLRQIRWVPADSKFTPAKNSDFDDKFPLYLMRRVAASYGVTPNDLGFTENVNRATGDTQIDVQFRVGIIPLLRHCEDVINMFLSQHLKVQARIHIDDGREVEDRVATAQAHQIYLNCGVESTDEVRVELGLPIDKSRPTPRYIAVPKGNPMPLIALDAAAGAVNPETFGPAASQKEPPVPPTAPVPALQAGPEEPEQAGPPEDEAGSKDDQPDALKAALRVIDSLLDKLEKDGPGITGGTLSTGGPLSIGAPDNTGGPGVTRSFSNPITDSKVPAKRNPTTITGGMMVDTDLQGIDLIGDEEEDEEEEADKAIALTLRQWRENARNRVKKGLPPKLFPDADPTLARMVWPHLAQATTPEEVNRAFAKAALEGPPDPKGRPGPWGHLEEQLTEFWQAPILAALVASVSAYEVAKHWLDQREELAGMAQDAGPFTASMSLDHEPLKAAVHKLYVDSWVAGMKDAATQLGSKLNPSSMAAQVLDRVDWAKWKPGQPEPEDLAGTGFSTMEAQLEHWVPEMDQTTRGQIAEALQRGLDEGSGPDAIAKDIDAVLHNPVRAKMIARTEVNRSMTQATTETYRRNGIQEWNLLTAADPCPICAAIAASNPHPMSDVAQLPPRHPACRCGCAPVVRY